MLESPASCFAFRYGASLNMTGMTCLRLFRSILRLFSRPMPQFAYRARDAKGALVEGVLDCPDRSVAIRQIEQQRCIPIRVAIVGAGPAAAVPNAAEANPATQCLKIPHGPL